MRGGIRPSCAEQAGTGSGEETPGGQARRHLVVRRGDTWWSGEETPGGQARGHLVVRRGDTPGGQVRGHTWWSGEGTPGGQARGYLVVR